LRRHPNCCWLLEFFSNRPIRYSGWRWVGSQGPGGNQTLRRKPDPADFPQKYIIESVEQISHKKTSACNIEPIMGIRCNKAALTRPTHSTCTWARFQSLFLVFTLQLASFLFSIGLVGDPSASLVPGLVLINPSVAVFAMIAIATTIAKLSAFFWNIDLLLLQFGVHSSFCSASPSKDSRCLWDYFLA